MELNYTLYINGFMSLVAFFAVKHIVPRMSRMFIDAHLYGRDLCKKDQTKTIPESQGVIGGCVYLVILFCFIPIQFGSINLDNNIDHHHQHYNQQNHLFVQFLAGLLSICCMLFLGFADDVLNLRWCVKLFLPTLASLPLLLVYALTYDNTTIIVPKPLRTLIGFSINLGSLYYVYLSLLAVFCTNAINILAGINGLEVGQSILISVSIMIYNIVELVRASDHYHSHIFSLNMMMPFLAISYALLYHNRYPARIFVGDTFCYFAGMTFAVVGILGHFSKTMLLFFLPQIFNFLYSCPQLFHFLPCPRHRLPKYNRDTDRLEPSTFIIVDINGLGTLSTLILKTLSTLKLIRMKQQNETNGQFECSNLTLINLSLVLLGPMKEPQLTRFLLLLQSIGTLLAFFIRYGLSELFY